MPRVDVGTLLAHLTLDLGLGHSGNHNGHRARQRRYALCSTERSACGEPLTAVVGSRSGGPIPPDRSSSADNAVRTIVRVVSSGDDHRRDGAAAGWGCRTCPPSPTSPAARAASQGVPAPVGGLHNRRAVMAGGGPAAQQAVKAALTKLGTYVWGAKGTNNFDCSGLTLWAYCQAGITLGCPTPTPRSRTANRLRRVTSRPVV